VEKQRRVRRLLEWELNFFLEDKITLDRTAFKALASETRVSILKKLGVRRATPSELAASLGVSAQAASEHLTQLERAGLVRREDEGRKWVYYSLTDKGKALVRPEDAKRVWVLLGTGAIALAVGFSRFFTSLSPFSSPAASLNSLNFPAVLSSVGTIAPQAFRSAPPAIADQVFSAEAVVAKAANEGAQSLAATVSPSAVPSVDPTAFVQAGVNAAGNCVSCGMTPIEIVLITAGCILVGASAYYYVKSKRERSVRNVRVKKR